MILLGRNLAQGLTGVDVAGLQTELSQLAYMIPATEQQASQFGAGTLASVQAFQTAQGLPVTGAIDAATAAALTSVIAASTYVVTGTVSSATSASVGVLTVLLVDKNVGGDVNVVSTTTGHDGSYQISTVIAPATLRARHKTSPDFQVRVSTGTVATAQTFLAASGVQYSAASKTTLNVSLPPTATGLPSEHDTLKAAIAALYPGTISQLKEKAQQQDITFLANKAGWDARTIAMAALADQFSQITTPAQTPATGAAASPSGLQPAFYYALFRAGLPANPDQLFQASPSGVQAIWQQAISQGVIPASLQSSLATAVQTFQALSAAHTLAMPPKLGVSTLQAQVAPILASSSQQTQFAGLLSQYHDDWSKLWPAVTTAFGPTVTQQLQLAGQLHFLTLNNAPLVAALNQAESQNPLKTILDLATRGYYEASKWTPLIAGSVPAGLTAGNYAEFLAAQIRIAFPTAVLGDQVKRGVMPITAAGKVADEVATFLANNQANFVIGAEPIQAFIAREKITSPSAAAIAQIKRLQRTYQLTTEDASMAVLLRHNLDSAYAVTRYDEAGFIRAFAGQLGGTAPAKRLHYRAKQIFSSVLNVATTYAGSIIGASQGNIGRIIHHGPIGKAHPSVPVSATLQGLFGSLDYLACTDCSSILSPAAYLVDLLHYIDQPSPTQGFQNPQSVLFTRRPDLQYLPLSCENTNVALPYIDIVNETLEFFVANSLSLANYQGHDTGSVVTSAELLASPQYVNDAAYTALQSAFFPAPLPFNRPLELLRLQLQSLGVALPDAMIALRADDSVSNRTTPASYGWSDILIEQLGISRDEYRLFTDSTLQLGDLYGLPNATALSSLQSMNLQQFSRLVGVSYVDLIAILQTRFINPAAALIPKLQALGVTIPAIENLYVNAGSQPSLVAQFTAALPPGLDPSQYGGTDSLAVVNWLSANNSAIMGLITIANPSGAQDDGSGTSLQFRYAKPDNTQNMLTATDFLKLFRFIRLWLKLQPLLNDPSDRVTITGTDALLAALYPAGDLPVQPGNSANDGSNRPLLDTGFGVTLLRAGFLFQVLNRLSLTADGSLLQLLACWAPIGTFGPNALYQKMFLTPTLLQQDPGAQTATVSSAVNAGDILTTQINTVSLTHTVASGETAAAVATSIAAAINANTTTDPVSNTPLNARFLATALSNQVIIKAGFALSCSGGGGSQSFAAAAVSPLSKTATIGGTPVTGSTLTVTIDTLAISYVVAPGDTLATIAANIAIAINGTTVAHPFSGLPLNTLVAASAAAGVVTVNAANAGAPFSLLCSIKAANFATYGTGAPVPAGYSATINGSIGVGNVLTISINGVPFTYTTTAADTTTTRLAASVANAINTCVQQDPATMLPFGSVVHATSNTNVVTVNPIDPATSFSLTIATTSGAETVAMSGPSPASQTATIAGNFPAGAILTTTINGLSLYYAVVAGDTAASVATAIAQSINTNASADPVYNLPLNSFVSAAASGGVITVTAANPTTAFTLAVTASASSYTAGRLSPPFADNGYGVYLNDATQTLFGHEPLLCAACNLTGAEFAQIAAALTFDATTVLSLNSVSALFRYGWLAHTLGLSVPEFLSMRQFSGLDPFAPLDPLSSTPAEPPVIRFIRLLQAMNSGNLAAVQALYLVWNQDISGTLAPAQSQIASLCFALRANFAAVEAQFVLRDDPDGSIAQSLMALVYTAAVTDFFFGLLNNTFSVSVPFAYASPALPQSLSAASGGLLAYDSTALKLSFSGLLTNAAETVIAAAATINTTDTTDNLAAGAVTLTPVSMANIVPGTVLVIDSGAAKETVVVGSVTATSFTTTTTLAHNGTTTPFAITNDPNLPVQLAALAAASQQAVAPFFATYPELRPLYAAYAASTDPIPTRRQTLLANFLPTLKSIRKAEQALAEITASIGCDPSFASALLQDPTVLHADADPTAAAVIDLTAIEAGGLSAQFFLGNDPHAAAGEAVDAASPMHYGQTAVLSGIPATGAVVTTTINGTAIPYIATATDTTIGILAGSVVGAINACTAKDAVSGLPINRLVIAAVISGGTIGITGAELLGANSVFTLACASSLAAVTYTAASELPAGNAGGPIAAVWQGFITVSQNGNYNFSVVTDAGANVTLRIGGITVPMALASGVWSNQAQVSLSAGSLVPIVLSASSIKTTFAFGWQSPPGLGWGVVPSASLYPLNLVTRLGDTYVRFLKATSLASALSLSADEIAWLGTDTTRSVNTSCAGTTAIGTVQFTPQSMANITHGSTLAIDTGTAQEIVTVTATTANSFTAVAAHAHTGATTPFPIVSAAAPAINLGWLSTLPGQPDPNPATSPLPDLATAARLTRVLTAVLHFAAMKQALSPNDERLLTVLQAPGATLPNGQSALLSLTGWAQVSVNALLTQFFKSLAPAALTDVEAFARLYTAMQIVQTCRVAASTLIAAVTNAPTATIVATLQSALRGLYAERDWLTIVRPINDAIRTRQRDALVAYILQKLSGQPGNTILTADDLYAWFLIDPLTQPPVETSRIRLALSSVQLFIERIVRNMEPSVSPADIDATQWEWMKRYRVWQANREVFLWPENWLYPQLRDDQSPMFQQMMSALQQGDITDDAAADAYLDYLTSLEEVAKLEPCGLYHVPGTADVDEISYVVSRTAGAHRKYFFRHLQGGSWSPWAQVSIECEDMPLTPIVWNNRLFLFWLKVLKQSPVQAGSLPAPANPGASKLALTGSGTTIGDLQSAGPSTLAKQVTVQAALCWCEYYNGKWQPMKTSDLNRPTTIGSFAPSGANSFEAYRNQVKILPATVTGNFPYADIEAPAPLPSLPGNALILAISTPIDPFPLLALGGSGFLLHNTHSSPIPLEDIPVPDGYGGNLGDYLDIPTPCRLLEPPYDPYQNSAPPYTGGTMSDTFFGYYYQTPWDFEDGAPEFSPYILDFNWQPRIVDSQPGLADAWYAPFLYEDRRNLFYVTTTLSLQTVYIYRGWGAYNYFPVQQTKPPAIPPLQIGRIEGTPGNISIGLTAKTSVAFQGARIGAIGATTLPKAVR